MSSTEAELVCLIDVDNTLLDNDRIQADLGERLLQVCGVAGRERYAALLEQLWQELGYRDYLGALQRLRVERPLDVELLAMASFFIDYPFAARLFPGALQVIAHLRRSAPVVVLTDGDAVFQPLKVQRSGIAAAADGQVLIYIHKELALDDVQRRYPARHYLLIDDKLRILTAVKAAWTQRVTTVFARQGQFALDAQAVAALPPADRRIERIADLLAHDAHQLAAAPHTPKITVGRANPAGERTMTPNTATAQLHALGQSLWLDNITRALLASGTLQRYIDEWSVTGLTSNPTIFDHALKGSTDYDADIRAKLAQGKSGEALFFELALQDITRAADLFRPVHERTRGVDGWVSLEVSPLLAYDTQTTLQVARELHARAARPNLFIKIPGTREGLPAIEAAVFAGVPVNVTLLFSTAHYQAAAEAWLRGIERRLDAGLPPDVGSVASLFVSRWDVAVVGKVPAALEMMLGVAIGRQAYRAYGDFLASPRCRRVMNEGAVPQRLLLASTGTKDPKASDTLYVEALAAPFTVNTMPEGTLKAFAGHGRVGLPTPADGGDCEAVLARFRQAGIDLDALAARLQSEGAASFVASWNELMRVIASKSASLAA